MRNISRSRALAIGVGLFIGLIPAFFSAVRADHADPTPSYVRADHTMDYDAVPAFIKVVSRAGVTAGWVRKEHLYHATLGLDEPPVYATPSLSSIVVGHVGETGFISL